MPLAPGTKLGPYELGTLIGAGGMGEVYRARDGRLGRDVAVKVLPPEVATDPDRLRRFAQEAQAVGALSHPNILSIHDLGEQDGVHYLVTELLEGETVRRRLDAGALPARKAVELATQMAHGLAAAHAAGIVHRDLKPENVFLTRDGRVKILDFGLARNVGPALRADDHAVDTAAPTATSPGTVLGTVGYLSPEQVRGEPADHRSDIFSFGAVLYELLTGLRAFRASTGVEIMSAILRQEPDEISRTVPDVSPGLDRIVRRCLEKNPDERFQSARDLAYTLGELSHASSGSHVIEGLRTGSRPARRALAAAGLVVAVAALTTAGYLLGQRTGPGDLELDYLQLTFRKGTITGARFAPDGQTVVYSARWDGEPSELFTTAPGSPESRPLGLPGAGLLALSSAGDLAVALDQWRLDNFQRGGTLARQPLATSTAPRKLQEDVLWADWSPDGRELAVVVQVDGRSRLEYPAGTLLFDTEGWLSHPRISPGGDLVAFLEHPGVGDDRGHVAVVDRQGAYRQLGPHWATVWGLAWHPDGKEIWFTAGPDAYLTVRRLNGMTLDGEHRALAVSPGEMTLHDVSRDGRVLLTVEDRRRNLVGRGPGATHERSLTWLDRSILVDLSSDGHTLLFHEGGRAGGTFGSVYVRRTDGSAAVRLGDGYGLGLSADERWAMVFVPRVPREMYLLPLGAGNPRRLGADSPQLLAMRFVGMAAEGQRGVFESRDDGAAPIAILLDLDTGEGRPLAPAGYGPVAVTGDGRILVLVGPDGESRWLLPTAGGELQPIAGVEPGERVIQTSIDGTVVYLRRDVDFTARIDRLDRATGRRELLHELEPPDRAGSDGVDVVRLTPDGRHYVFGYLQQLSELYLSRQIR